ncbi:CHAT domain-containing protein [Endothiovibrio diazotrophicus]
MHTAEPLRLTPDPGLLSRHPHVKSLASRLASRYLLHELVDDDQLRQVGGALMTALDAAERITDAHRQAGTLVLPLIIETADPALLNLPWECLHHPELGFLGSDHRFTLSRRIPEVAVDLPPLAEGPLRVLLFTAQPDDLDAEKERLDTEEEQARVLEALTPWIGSGHVALEAPDDGRFATFERLVREGGFQLVFLSGHGRFHDEPHLESPWAGFLFEGPEGLGEEVDETRIADAFTGSGVRCVVLAACQSGKAASDTLNTGLARRLALRGIPHVVGMRESILDRAGILFAHALCGALGRQLRVDQAVQQGRKAILRPLEGGGAYRDIDGSPLAELSLGQWPLPMLLSHDPAAPLIDPDFTATPPEPRTRYNSNLDAVELPATFIGRRRELRTLAAPLLEGRRHQLLITGPGGQGKTALAGQLARRLQERGFTVHAWSARPGNPWPDFFAELIFTLEDARIERHQKRLPLATTAKLRARLLLELLVEQHDGRLTLFLDNLEEIQDPESGEIDHEEVNAWIAEAPRFAKAGLCLLATSRRLPPGWPAEAHHFLRHPSYGDFLRYLQQQRPARSDRARLRRLYKTLGGNLRGLNFFLRAAPQLDEEDETAFLEKLEGAQQELQTDMAIDRLIDHLEETPRELLSRLRVYTTPVPADGVRKLALDLDAPLDALATLVARSLVEAGRAPDLLTAEYALEPQVADRLRRTLPRPPTPWFRAAADYQRHLFDHERPTVEQALTVHQALVDAGETNGAHRFALTTLIPWYDRRGLYRTLLDQWLPPITTCDDPKLRGDAISYAGKFHHALGEYNTALQFLNQSLAIQREIGDRSGEGTTLNNLSQIHDARGDYDTALQFLNQSLAIRREIGDRSGEGTTLNNLSQIHHERGDYDTALQFLNQSLAIQREIGDSAGLCATLFNIGHIHWQNGEQQEALGAWIDAYGIATQIGHAQVLAALEGLAKQLGGDGLSLWEELAGQLETESAAEEPSPPPCD